MAAKKSGKKASAASRMTGEVGEGRSPIREEVGPVLTAEVLRYRLMSIEDFVSITAEAAALLAEEGGHQKHGWSSEGLNGLRDLSVASAENLAGYKDELSLNGMTSLSAEVAQCLRCHLHGLSLGGLLELSDEAAENISEHRGKRLTLTRLQSLSDKAIKSLSSYEGTLDLSGLTCLSDTAAQALSEHKGPLVLDGLTTLSEIAARALSKHEEEVSLMGLNALSDEAAVALSNKSIKAPRRTTEQIQAAVKRYATTSSELDSKTLSKLRKLIKTNEPEHLAVACELLVSLNATEGDWLKLFSKSRMKTLLSTWEPEIWNTLASAMIGHPKCFNELINQAKQRVNSNSSDWAVHSRYNTFLTQLVGVANDDAMKLLDGARDFIKFYGNSISDSAAENLSKFSGRLYCENIYELSDCAGHLALLEKLSQQGPLRLSLDSLSDAAAEILSRHQGSLDLGLISLSDAAAESLSRHQGGLSLGQLESLSDAAAESLSRLQGDLSLGGLKSLSNAAAESLSSHEGDLYLWGLESLSDTAAASLSKHRGKVYHGLETT